MYCFLCAVCEGRVDYYSYDNLENRIFYCFGMDIQSGKQDIPIGPATTQVNEFGLS